MVNESTSVFVGQSSGGKCIFEKCTPKKVAQHVGYSLISSIRTHLPTHFRIFVIWASIAQNSHVRLGV